MREKVFDCTRCLVLLLADAEDQGARMKIILMYYGSPAPEKCLKNL